MAEYKVVNATQLDNDLTSVATKIRELSGTASKLGLDGMVADLQKSIDEVALQKDLIDQAVEELEGKASGGESIDGIPNGYARCDYIYFDGAQIVDTGIICNQDTKLQVCFTRERSTQHYLFGIASSDNTASVTAYLGGSWRFGNKYATKTITNVRGDMVYTGIVSSSEISANNGVGEISGVNAFETVGSLLLGSCRNADGCVGNPQFQGKIFHFALWQGEEQVLKLVPVVSADGQYRFFDMASKTFFDSITDTALSGGCFDGSIK